MDPKDISELQHEEFYRYIAQAYDKPRFTLHYKTDAPLNISSIFYVPETVRCLTVHSIALGPELTQNTQGGSLRITAHIELHVFAILVQGLRLLQATATPTSLYPAALQQQLSQIHSAEA